jgi:hypothetical protein
MVTTDRLEKAVWSERRELARPAPAPVFVEHEAPPTAAATVPTASNSTLTHLDAAISDLGKEVEMDKRDLARLEALQRGIAKKQELLAALIEERDKFVGQPMKAFQASV